MTRKSLKRLTEIPNIGKAMERDFLLLGIERPADLIGRDPYQLYEELCRVTQKKHDPCVLDVFISAVRYMEGGPPKKWWEFTEERKRETWGRMKAGGVRCGICNVWNCVQLVSANGGRTR